jgi:heme o synthase
LFEDPGMSDLVASIARPAWRDLLEMCKPRVVLLMLLCAVVGMFLATPGMVPFDALVFGTLGIALVAASAAAVNHIADAQIDARMARTHNRPVADGRINVKQGLLFSAVLGIGGLWVLYVLVNPLTAWLNLASWVGYALIYTLFLKRATPQNIVIGGLFGAAPPLFGWAAVSNSVEAGALLLVLIIFAWTPPHFWALALDRKDEYRDASVPMLPVTHGETYTRWHILFYTMILFAISLLPFAIAMSGIIYLAAATALGIGFMYWAVVLLRGKNPRAPIETFRYSIIYLMVLFIALLVDHYLPIGLPVLQAGTEFEFVHGAGGSTS